MKKTMSIVLAAAMCLSMAVTAFATQIQPRAISCPDCGGSTHRDYILEKEYPCSNCGERGCGMYWWIWECDDSSCGGYEYISEKGYACE